MGEQFSELLKRKVLILDGAMGTHIQAEKDRGTKLHECYDYLNISSPDLIRSIHRAYVDAGADIIETNTFGANRAKLGNYRLADSVQQINQRGVMLAREAIEQAGKTGQCLVAGSVGPIGEYLEPFSTLTFDQAYDLFVEQLKALRGADLILIETISDIRVAKAAVIAAKDTVDIPIVCCLTFEGGRTATGTDIETFATVVEALGVSAIGVNCGAGPAESMETVDELLRHTSLPVVVYTNAGIPRLVDGLTVFDSSPEEFAAHAQVFAKKGVNIIGGCCGTTPDYIHAIHERVQGIEPGQRKASGILRLSSRTKTLRVDDAKNILIIGERINPTNRKALALEIEEGKTKLILQEALAQVSNGAALLDINVGLPGIDESAILTRAVAILQNSVDIPLVLDCGDPEALESALKQADGKVLINSISGESTKLPILDLAKRYGAAVIALTMDDSGVPKSAEQRIKVAEKILRHAEDIGFPKQDIIFDTMTMSIAVDKNNADITLDALKSLNEKGFKSVLGISNISHGLPNRDEINAMFLAKAKGAGLNFAIMNPNHNVCVEDGNLAEYAEVSKETVDYDALPIEKQLYNAILYGDCDNIISVVESALAEHEALDINEILVSALEEVGVRFREKRFFLPQVLLSANAMKLAFDRLKQELKHKDGKPKGKVVFATVKHDLHDIGKNIVSALLESYNYEIVDLGKNVSRETILANAQGADIIALSALMTTTVREMEKTVKFLRESGIDIPIMIGGAVVTRKYAESIGCHYSEDAVNTVVLVNQLIMEKKEEE